MNFSYSILILVLTITFSSNAQKNIIGVQSGAAVSFSPHGESSYFDPGVGVVIDVIYQRLMQGFYLKTTVGFEQKAYSDEFIFMDEFGNIIDGSKYHLTNNYLCVSQQIGVRYGDVIMGFTNVGIAGYRYFNSIQKQESFTFGGNYYDETREITNFGNSYDVAATIESGIEIHIAEASLLYLSATYSHGFIAQWESSYLKTKYLITNNLYGHPNCMPLIVCIYVKL